MADPLEFKYEFRFPDSTEACFDVRLDPLTLEPVDQNKDSPPDWTRLEFLQCVNCPWTEDKHRYCPLARNLVSIVATFSEFASYEKIDVVVSTPDRKIEHPDETIQRATSSLIGLIMATSGCPNTDFLKPMARFHLPFANRDETIYRAASMYLLGQYFRSLTDKAPDWNLAGLRSRYENLQQVNLWMVKRLRTASQNDATVNAVVILDMLAKMMPYSIEDALEDCRHLFVDYMR